MSNSSTSKSINEMREEKRNIWVWILWSPIILGAAIFILVIVLWAYSSINDKLSYYVHPEKYTKLVPAYLEASKPRLLVDTTNFLGGGYIAITMLLSDDVTNKIKANPKFLNDSWVPTPISETEIKSNGSPKAEFINYISYDKCAGCDQLYKDARQPGNYYLTPYAPRTTRVGIIIVPSAKRIYYIESGN